jgi:hypothetical protein
VSSLVPRKPVLNPPPPPRQLSSVLGPLSMHVRVLRGCMEAHPSAMPARHRCRSPVCHRWSRSTACRLVRPGEEHRPLHPRGLSRPSHRGFPRCHRSGPDRPHRLHCCRWCPHRGPPAHRPEFKIDNKSSK